MSSHAKWAGLLPELETADRLASLAEPKHPHDRRRCGASHGTACRLVRAMAGSVKVAAHVAERFLTTFAVLEILGVLLLMIFLQI